LDSQAQLFEGRLQSQEGMGGQRSIFVGCLSCKPKLLQSFSQGKLNLHKPRSRHVEGGLCAQSFEGGLLSIANTTEAFCAV